MVPLRPGEDGRAKASWREAACGTVSFHDAEGKRLKTLYLGRMPESGKVTLKAQLASEVAHIRQLRPDVRIVAVADGALGQVTRRGQRLRRAQRPIGVVEIDQIGEGAADIGREPAHGRSARQAAAARSLAVASSSIARPPAAMTTP